MSDIKYEYQCLSKSFKLSCLGYKCHFLLLTYTKQVYSRHTIVCFPPKYGIWLQFRRLIVCPLAYLTQVFTASWRNSVLSFVSFYLRTKRNMHGHLYCFFITKFPKTTFCSLLNFQYKKVILDSIYRRYKCSEW